MSGVNRYLLDSNVIIRISKRDTKLSNYIESLEAELFISVISLMEVLGYNFTNPEEEKLVREIVKSFDVVYLDDVIAYSTIKLRKKIKIKLPDAIIAATAIEYNCPLITANYDDFKNIDELEILAK